MKPRVQMDIVLLVGIIALSWIFYFSPQLHNSDPTVDAILDFLGFVSLIKGTLLRMIARGHKKSHSEKSHSLVTTGVYSVVRNPMYLGTFMIGLGFILILWPWWTVPIFAIAFYLRFRRQIEKEETFLRGMFGEQYQHYCDQTPRLFPNIKKIFNIKAKEIFSFDEAFSTKEKFGLLSWPLLALGLAFIQQGLIYHFVNWHLMIFLLFVAALTVGVGLWVFSLIK